MLPNRPFGSRALNATVKDGLTQLVGSPATPILSGPARGLWLKGGGSSANPNWVLTNDELEILSKLCQPGWTVWDCGGHDGYLSVLFSRFVGHDGMVVFFETERNRFLTTYENASLNGCHNILYLFASIESGVAKPQPCPPAMPKQITLDEAYQDNEIPVPQLIRMDLSTARLNLAESATRLINEHRPCFIFNQVTEPAWGDLKNFATVYGYELLSLQDGSDLSAAPVPSITVLCVSREKAS